MLLGLVVLLYLWPALVQGDLLSPVAMLYGLAPWTTSQPPDLAQYYNSLLSDVPMSHYPWNLYARDFIRDGVFPAWNPHAFAGVPFFANPQTVLFSPFSIPIWALPLNYGIGISAALKLWAAAVGTYLLVRELRLGFMPGLVAGIGYGLCSFHVVWLTHESLPAVSALLPWMILLTERLVRKRSIPALLGLAVMTAVALGGGHPGTQLHVLAATFLYGAIRAGTTRDVVTRERFERVVLVGAGLTLGVVLIAAMFVPELLSARGTLGTEARRAGEATSPGFRLSIRTLATTVFPDFWGRPSAYDTTPELDKSLANYNERTFYAGVVVVLLASISLFVLRDWRRKAPFAVLALLALAIPLRMPGVTHLLAVLPGFSVVQNQRVHFVFEFGAAVLAAFGLQALLSKPKEIRWQLWVPLGAIGVAAIALLSIGPTPRELATGVGQLVEGRTAVDRQVISTASVAWFVVFSAAAALALLALRRWPRRRFAIGAALVLVAAFDMLHFAHGYQPMGPASKLIPPRTPAIAYLQRHAEGARFVGLQYTLPNAWSLVYGLDDIRGYDPPQPSMRFFRLWQEANPDQLNWAPFVIEALTPTSVQVISVLGARYVIADPSLVELADDSPPMRWLRRVYVGPDATIFENSAALPRVMIAPRLQVATDEDDARSRLIADDFDPRESVVVERGESGIAKLAGGPLGRGTVRIARESNASITLATRLDRAGLVVLNDNFTAGWSVRVDGDERSAVRVNDVMRGVVVGAGTHEVTWSYTVPGLRLGVALSVVGWIVLAAVAVALLWRRTTRTRRRSVREPPA